MRWSPQIRRIEWLTARPIAHRGLHDWSKGIVENTASAFAAAMEGNYAIECDLQLTKDGQAVVFHDDTLNRVTNGTGWIKDHTVEELKAVTFKTGPDHIQTLDELLRQVDRRVPLVIELKSNWDGDTRLTQRALEVLAPYGGPYALMSFDPDPLQYICENSPATIRGIVADRTIDGYYANMPLARRLELRNLSHLDRTRPDFISFYWKELPFEPVNNFRAAGLPVITWTLRSAEQASIAMRYCDQVTFEGFKA